MKLRTGNHLDSPLTPPSWDYFLPFIRIGAPRSSRLISSHPSAIFYARFEQGRGKKEEEKKKKKGEENKVKIGLNLRSAPLLLHATRATRLVADVRTLIHPIRAIERSSDLLLPPWNGRTRHNGSLGKDVAQAV